MITIVVDKTRLDISGRDEYQLTAGMANVVQCQFVFSDDWSDLSKTAVFTNGKTTVDVVLADEYTCNIPHEILTTPLTTALVGVYGTDGDVVVLPTIWGGLGVVYPAADPSGDESVDPTLPVWQQILGQIGNLSDLATMSKDSLVSAINELYKTGGSGSGTGGMAFDIDGITLTLENGVLSVNTADAVEENNTLPITSAAVATTVGNIEILLETI